MTPNDFNILQQFISAGRNQQPLDSKRLLFIHGINYDEIIEQLCIMLMVLNKMLKKINIY